MFAEKKETLLDTFVHETYLGETRFWKAYVSLEERRMWTDKFLRLRQEGFSRLDASVQVTDDIIATLILRVPWNMDPADQLRSVRFFLAPLGTPSRGW